MTDKERHITLTAAGLGSLGDGTPWGPFQVVRHGPSGGDLGWVNMDSILYVEPNNVRTRTDIHMASGLIVKVRGVRTWEVLCAALNIDDDYGGPAGK